MELSPQRRDALILFGIFELAVGIGVALGYRLARFLGR